MVTAQNVLARRPLRQTATTFVVYLGTDAAGKDVYLGRNDAPGSKRVFKSEAAADRACESMMGFWPDANVVPYK